MMTVPATHRPNTTPLEATMVAKMARDTLVVIMNVRSPRPMRMHTHSLPPAMDMTADKVLCASAPLDSDAATSATPEPVGTVVTQTLALRVLVGPLGTAASAAVLVTSSISQPVTYPRRKPSVVPPPANATNA
jgi:hypothetical protein